METERPGSSTEQHPLLQEALAEIERLRCDIRARDDMLAVASHELRNPLHVLTLQIASARLAAQAREQMEIASRLSKAESLLARYAERLGVLLDLSRLQANAYPLNLHDVDLAVALSQFVESLRPEAEYHRVELSFSGPAAHAVVRTDPLALEQVLGNLLVNAFKHSGCSHATLTLDDPGADHVEIRVADNGRGIPEPEQQRIFEKFAVGRTPVRGGGSGLGLWIVRRLVDALGANISLQSRPGAGSVFLLRLPRHVPGSVAKHPMNRDHKT